MLTAVFVLLIADMALSGYLLYVLKTGYFIHLPDDVSACDAVPSDSVPEAILKPLGNSDEREYQLERKRISEGKWQAYN